MKTKILTAKNARNAKPTDSQMLDWIALYATEINTIVKKSGAKYETVEIVASDEDDLIVVTRKSKGVIEAFRKCLKAAMKQLPRKS